MTDSDSQNRFKIAAQVQAVADEAVRQLEMAGFSDLRILRLSKLDGEVVIQLDGECVLRVFIGGDEVAGYRLSVEIPPWSERNVSFEFDAASLRAAWRTVP